MADGNILITTEVDKSGLKSGLKSLGTVTKKSVGGITKSIGLASTAIAGLGAMATGVGMEFESSMSAVGAISGATASEMELLSDTAKEMGSTTQFSASQSADALQYLALAGFEATESVEALPSVLSLAAAGGMDLASTSDMVTDSMSALGLSINELEGFTDEMARTSQKSNTSVAQLGEAILTVGGTAKILSGGTNELNTNLGLLANAGIKGAEGGTKLRNVILSLTSPTDKAKKQMKELGVEVFDAEGNMRPLNDVMGDLNEELGDMSDKDKQEALSGIFNKADLKGVNALMSQSGDAFDELSANIADSEGAAKDMAEIMNDNLEGSLTSMNSALEGVGISMYENFQDPLKDVVDNATGLVQDMVKTLNEEGLAGIGDAVGEMLTGVLTMVADNLPSIVEAGVDILVSLISGIMDNLPILMPSIIAVINTMVDGMVEMLPLIIETALQIMLALALGLAEALPELIPSIVDMMLTIVDVLLNNLDMLVDASLQIIIALALGLIKALPKLVEKVPEIIFKLVATLLSLLDKLDEAGAEMVGALFDSIFAGAVENFDDVKKIGSNIIRGVWDGIKGMKTWISNKVSDFFGGITDTAKGILGIHSPSRVFAKEVGSPMAQGVNVGFDDELGDVYKDLEKSITSENSKLNAELEANSDIASSVTVGGTVRVEGVNDKGELVAVMDAIKEDPDSFGRVLEPSLSKIQRKKGRSLAYGY